MAKPLNPVVREAVQETYLEYDTPADQIVASHDSATCFADSVNSRLPDNLKMTVTKCNSLTLSLRKKGEDKGGLPKLRGGHGPSTRPSAN